MANLNVLITRVGEYSEQAYNRAAPFIDDLCKTIFRKDKLTISMENYRIPKTANGPVAVTGEVDYTAYDYIFILDRGIGYNQQFTELYTKIKATAVGVVFALDTAFDKKEVMYPLINPKLVEDYKEWKDKAEKKTTNT